MPMDEILQQEIRDSELWLSKEKDESTYKRDQKEDRVNQLALQNVKNPNVEIYSLIEFRMNETIQEI